MIFESVLFTSTSLTKVLEKHYKASDATQSVFRAEAADYEWTRLHLRGNLLVQSRLRQSGERCVPLPIGQDYQYSRGDTPKYKNGPPGLFMASRSQVAVHCRGSTGRRTAGCGPRR